MGSLNTTAFEWSPAERLVSGAAPSAISPSVDEQSVPRLSKCRFASAKRKPSSKESRNPRLTTREVPVYATTPIDDAIRKEKTLMGKAAAAARHAENRPEKEHVFKYLDANPPGYRKKDQCATDIAEKQVTAKFRTVRKWIDEWEKDRAAGTL